MGQRKQRQLLMSASGFAALTAYSGSYLFQTWENDSSWILHLIIVSMVIASLLATLVCVDIWRLQPADSHTLGTLLSQYIALTKLRIMAPFVLRSFKQMTREAAVKTITQTLLQIIRSNQDTEYGRKYSFSKINTIEDFTRLHPLTTHEHYKSMIDKIWAGEQNILHQGETVFIGRSSGTTGASKLFPLSRNYLRKKKYAIDVTTVNMVQLLDMKRFFKFYLFTQVNKSPGGIQYGPGSLASYRHPKHSLIPEEYQKLLKEDSSFYAMAVFALAERELSHIDSFSPDCMNSFMKFMIANWESICQDIERGAIGDAVDMPEEIRVSLSKHLQPNPERAEFLRQIVEKGIVGLAKRAWPYLKFIYMAKSASFKRLATKLMTNHFKGVKVIGKWHIATEGVVGINFEEQHREESMQEVYTLYPTLCFMEFIPLENVDDQDPKVVQLHQLEIGKCYETVITNDNGLYRCRFGDIIKVVGYVNNIPKYMFLYRLGQTLNIAWERTPDTFLAEAMHQAKSMSNIHSDITDFVTTESTVIEEITGEPSKGHYVFFIEFNEKLIHVFDLARKIDKCLIDSYEPYKLERDVDTIGDLEVIQVKPGTMESIKGIVTGGLSNPYFKMPRVLHNMAAIRRKIMDEELDLAPYHVQPYSFEPTISLVEQDSSETESESEEERELLTQDDWCSCNECINMPSDGEKICCNNIPAIQKRLYDGEFQCITQHPGFQGNCLNKYVLEASIYEFVSKEGRFGDEEPVHELMRYIAYRRFTRWIFGVLGKKKRKILPACVVTTIRKQYPSDFYLGFIYPVY